MFGEGGEWNGVGNWRMMVNWGDWECRGERGGGSRGGPGDRRNMHGSGGLDRTWESVCTRLGMFGWKVWKGFG